MKLIDTHTHFYSLEFENDFSATLERARNAGVTKFFLPMTDSTVTDKMLNLEALYPQEFFPMMGLHPCSVQKNFLEELEKIKKNLSQRRFAAIGEIGLDFYWDTTFKKEQLEAFHQQMEWAIEFNTPVVIHTRNAMSETIDAVRPFAATGSNRYFPLFWRLT